MATLNSSFNFSKSGLVAVQAKIKVLAQDMFSDVNQDNYTKFYDATKEAISTGAKLSDVTVAKKIAKKYGIVFSPAAHTDLELLAMAYEANSQEINWSGYTW